MDGKAGPADCGVGVPALVSERLDDRVRFPADRSRVVAEFWRSCQGRREVALGHDRFVISI